MCPTWGKSIRVIVARVNNICVGRCICFVRPPGTPLMNLLILWLIAATAWLVLFSPCESLCVCVCLSLWQNMVRETHSCTAEAGVNALAGVYLAVCCSVCRCLDRFCDDDTTNAIGDADSLACAIWLHDLLFKVNTSQNSLGLTNLPELHHLYNNQIQLVYHNFKFSTRGSMSHKTQLTSGG